MAAKTLVASFEVVVTVGHDSMVEVVAVLVIVVATVVSIPIVAVAVAAAKPKSIVTNLVAAAVAMLCPAPSSSHSSQ